MVRISIKSFFDTLIRPEKRLLFWQNYDVCYNKKTIKKKQIPHETMCEYVTLCNMQNPMIGRIRVHARQHTKPYELNHDYDKCIANKYFVAFVDKYIGNSIGYAFAFDSMLGRSSRCLHKYGYKYSKILICERDYANFRVLQEKRRTVFHLEFSNFVRLVSLNKKISNNITAGFIDGMARLDIQQNWIDLKNFVKYLAHPNGCVIGYTVVKRLTTKGETFHNMKRTLEQYIANIECVSYVKFIKTYNYINRRNVVTMYFYIKK